MGPVAPAPLSFQKMPFAMRGINPGWHSPCFLLTSERFRSTLRNVDMNLILLVLLILLLFGGGGYYYGGPALGGGIGGVVLLILVLWLLLGNRRTV